MFSDFNRQSLRVDELEKFKRVKKLEELKRLWDKAERRSRKGRQPRLAEAPWKGFPTDSEVRIPCERTPYMW